MESRIIKGSSINLDNFILKHSNKNVNLKYENKPLVVQTPKMSMPWNLSCFKSQTRDDSFSITLSFKGREEDEELRDFYEKCVELDEYIMDEAKKNKKKWFGKDINDSSLKYLYTPIVKHSIDKNTGEPDGKYPSTIRVKIPFRNNKFQLKIFNNDKKEIDLNDTPLPGILVKDKEVKTLVKLGNIWIIDGKFGCSMNVVQVKILKNFNKPLNFLQNNSDESDDEFDVSSDDD
jgi:hypothetical protein